MADLVEEFERWQENGQQMSERLETRRTVVLAQIVDLKAELDLLNQTLMKLGTQGVAPTRARRKGQGSISPNRKGWRWRVCREGKTYVSKTFQDRQEAERGLTGALVALDQGKEPQLDVMRVQVAGAPAAADIPPDNAAAPPAPKKTRKPSAPDPDRIRLIAAAADRTGGADPTQAAGDMRAITRGIAKLPTRLANVARRHWLRGQKPELIARELQVTVKAVEEMLVEARQLAIAAEAA